MGFFCDYMCHNVYDVWPNTTLLPTSVEHRHQKVGHHFSPVEKTTDVAEQHFTCAKDIKYMMHGPTRPHQQKPGTEMGLSRKIMKDPFA